LEFRRCGRVQVSGVAVGRVAQVSGVVVVLSPAASNMLSNGRREAAALENTQIPHRDNIPHTGLTYHTLG
jgi:hypothetical protein